MISENPADPERLASLLETFGLRRACLVAVLERCSAQDLARVGMDPSRGPTTVADLVAIVLAHDTDQLGRLAQTAIS